MFKRSERLRELYLQEVSRIVAGLKDPGLSGFVTVTDLKLSPDMKTARVYYSILGSAADRESTASALERSTGHIRGALMERLTIKFIPKFVFVYDDTPERAHRIENLLSRLDQERSAVGNLPPPSAEEGIRGLKSLASGKRTRRKKRR